jgi:serine/threonine protein kinase
MHTRTPTNTGTVEYMPREMLTGEGYGSSADWWSFGILLYEMLYGSTPFKGKNWETTLQNIRRDADITLPSKPAVSKHCGRLLKSILCASSNAQRLDTGVKIKQHKWFRDINFQLIRNTTPPIVPKLSDDLDFRHFYRKKDESDVSEEEGDEPITRPDFEDEFDGFDWSRGNADPHWTMDPTVEGSPASRHQKKGITGFRLDDVELPSEKSLPENSSSGDC